VDIPLPGKRRRHVQLGPALELACLRDQALALLEMVPENVTEHAEAVRLRKFLHYIRPIQVEQIPPMSLLREFLGGSIFRI
jgi:uridine kinase